jgi:hypothetical protein
VKQQTSVWTKDVGAVDSLSDVITELDDRANAVRELYENGWETNVAVDGPNSITAIRGPTDDTDERPPITDEQWESVSIEDASSWIKSFDIIGLCPQCDSEVHSRQDEWSHDGKITGETEMFCHECSESVPRQPMEIRHTAYLKPHFEHVENLRSAAGRLKQQANWYRGLEADGWSLESDGRHLDIRCDVSEESSPILGSASDAGEVVHATHLLADEPMN